MSGWNAGRHPERSEEALGMTKKSFCQNEDLTAPLPPPRHIPLFLTTETRYRRMMAGGMQVE